MSDAMKTLGEETCPFCKRVGTLVLEGTKVRCSNCHQALYADDGYFEDVDTDSD